METIVKRFDGVYILVVEDYELNRNLVRDMLEVLGCVVDLAHNGREAVDMAVSKQYDIILMDIQLPVMDGIAAMKAIKSAGSGPDLNLIDVVPIIALTANALDGEREKFISQGMDDYMSKPIQTKDLIAMIEKHVKSSEYIYDDA